MSIVSKVKKQSGETRRVVLDYASRLEGSEILSVLAMTVCPVTDPPLTPAGAISFGTRVVSYVSGGLDGSEYLVTYRTTTADGRVFEDEVKFQIEDVTC